MVTQLPIKLWPCPSSVVQQGALGWTVIHSATASVEDKLVSLFLYPVNFMLHKTFFSIELGRLPFLQ